MATDTKVGNTLRASTITRVEVQAAIPWNGISADALWAIFERRVNPNSTGFQNRFWECVHERNVFDVATQAFYPKANLAASSMFKHTSANASPLTERSGKQPSLRRRPNESLKRRPVPELFVLVEGCFEKWYHATRNELIQRGLWLACSFEKPPIAHESPFSLQFSGWQTKETEAAKIIKKYVNPNLLSRIPAERWDQFQWRRGSSKEAFVRKERRKLPHERCGALTGPQTNSLSANTAFYRAGGQSPLGNANDYFPFHEGPPVPEHLTSGYYMLQKLKTFAQPFRLFDLPGELRNRIYEISLFEHEPVVVLDIKRKEHKVHRSPPAITCSSRRLRQETLPIYYHINRFEFVLDANKPNVAGTADWERNILARWVKKCLLGQLLLARNLRSLSVTLQVRVLLHPRYGPKYRMTKLTARLSSDSIIQADVSDVFAAHGVGKPKLAALLKLLRDAQKLEHHDGRKLLLYFLCPRLWQDWTFDPAKNQYIGGVVALRPRTV